MKRLIAAAFAATLAFPLAAAEPAAAFPSRAITLIVPTAAGGSMDAMARAVADEARKKLGQPIVVENRPGAGNTMAAIAMVGADPAGYTLGIVSCATLKLPHVTRSQYDPMKDLTYISRISDFALVIAVRADSPHQNVASLVNESKKSGLFYGTAGKYNSPHLATIRLAQATNANWTDVPFKGDSDAITALLAGDVQFIAASNSVIPFVQGGKLRALGVFADKRPASSLSGVQTVKEQGFGVVDTCPFGIMGPKGMDPAIVRKLDGAFQEAVRSPGVRSVADKFGFEPDYAGSIAFDAWARQSFETDRALFQKLGRNPE